MIAGGFFFMLLYEMDTLETQYILLMEQLETLGI